ncbi:MAG: GNAT family N-acetyltransferase, partial [Lachnospiraceae bacterium]|nr:GNAT family N-acetyltransferase [Lachnospiraceae bacterium]
MAITYKRIKLKMLTPDFLDTFDRHQEISKVFRAKDGKWLICDVSYTEEWEKMKKEQIIDYLRSVIKEKGILYGAYFDGNLVGFTGVEGKRFGSSRQYVKLAMIHVSYAFRGRGIGKELFSLAAVSAESLGAKKLYISGNSAVETQTFYRAMGCVETTEYDPDSLKAEPYDCHLEYDLRSVSRVTPVFMAL